MKAMQYVIFTMLLVACQPSPPHRISQEESITRARTYISQRLSTVPPGTVHVQDRISAWRVSFDPPEDSVGGPVTVDVDKRTGEMSNFHLEQ
jgi:hypothetical protein